MCLACACIRKQLEIHRAPLVGNLSVLGLLNSENHILLDSSFRGLKSHTKVEKVFAFAQFERNEVAVFSYENYIAQYSPCSELLPQLK